MSTPQVARKRPFSAVGGGDAPAVCSPQTRRSTALSSNNESLYQSPLPEVRNEEDIRERKGKRRSRNLTASTGSPFARPADDNSGEIGKLTNDQLASHYVNCIKLSTENKITAKNAFSLHLIDHMDEMLKQRCEGALNFQMAGGTIFASAKIYASRVDAVHSEAYKVMSSLGRGSNDDKGNDDAAGSTYGDEDEKKQPGKKKKKRSKILENNPSAIRLKQLEVSYQADPLDQYYASVFDVANTSGLLINHLLLCKDGLTVRYHSEVKPPQSCNVSKARMPENQDADHGETGEANEKQEQDYRQSFEDRFADLSNLHKALKDASICQSANEFTWDRREDSQPYQEDNLTDGESSQPEINMDYDDDNNIILDSAPTDNEDITLSNPIQAEHPDQQDAPLGMDEQLVTAFEPGEYSYFKPGAISTWEGPNHWKMKLHGKAPSSVAGTEISNDPGQRSKRKKMKKKFFINYSRSNVGMDEEGFERLKKSVLLTRRIKEKLKSTKNDRLLPAAGEYILPDLAKCNLQPPILVKPVSLIQRKRDDVDVDIDQLGMYNYDNPNDKNNYCPNATDDEDGFDPGDGIPANFATDYTTADCNASNFPDMTLSQPQSQAQSELDAMLRGEHLISHPRKIEKISIAYAKKATRIDVRKLKAAMWSVLKDQAQNTSTNTVVAGDASLLEPDLFDPSTESKTFSNLYYSGLQGLMPQSMAENLSIPLAFTCLLHLANEKSLCISSDSAMSDLHIGVPELTTEETDKVST